MSGDGEEKRSEKAMQVAVVILVNLLLFGMFVRLATAILQYRFKK
jgi:hypothetical protein